MNNMTTANPDSESQTARQRAREAMATDLEKTRKRQDALANVFTALDARDDANKRIGKSLTTMRELGETTSSIAHKTGLSTREITTLLKLTTTEQTTAH